MSWTTKKAECLRIDAFELWCWRRLLSPLDCKKIKPVNPKGNQSWIFIERTDANLSSNTLATWCQELSHWKRPWCWERLKAGGEGDDRGWEDWMASPTRWTWVWASSGSWWWTGKPGMLQSVRSERVRHNWATELNWQGLRNFRERKWVTQTASLLFHPYLNFSPQQYKLKRLTQHKPALEKSQRDSHIRKHFPLMFTHKLTNSSYSMENAKITKRQHTQTRAELFTYKHTFIYKLSSVNTVESDQ